MERFLGGHPTVPWRSCPEPSNQLLTCSEGKVQWPLCKAQTSFLSFFCPKLCQCRSCQTSSVGRYLDHLVFGSQYFHFDRPPRRHLLRTPSILCGWLQEFWGAAGAGAIGGWLVGFTTSDGYDHPYSEAWHRLTSLASHTGWLVFSKPGMGSESSTILSHVSASSNTKCTMKTSGVGTSTGRRHHPLRHGTGVEPGCSKCDQLTTRTMVWGEKPPSQDP